jgi:hypothetical protein
MNLSDEPIYPSDPASSSHEEPAPRPAPESRARRRRARRQIVPADATGRAALVAALVRRAYPNYEFFIYSVLCGSMLGLGYLLDSQAVLIFGSLLAPLLLPWAGMTLSLVIGSLRFFFETLTALLIGAALVLLIGALAGFASRPFAPLTLNNAFIHTRLWIPDLVVLVIGSILLTVSFVRSEDKPFLPSVMLAYSLFLPLCAAGFGLGSGVAGMWPQGLLVFAVHLALATSFGLTTFFILRFRPSAAGLAMSGATLAVVVATIVLLMGAGYGFVDEAGAAALPNSTPTNPPTSALALEPEATPSRRPTSTPRVETATPSTPSPIALTLEVTLPPTQTPTITLTFEPTPIYARISADEGGGVNLRKTPNGSFIATIDNGSIVEVLPEVEEVNGVPWAHVIATKFGQRLEGWMLQSVLVTATPIPNWEPSSTPALNE